MSTLTTIAKSLRTTSRHRYGEMNERKSSVIFTYSDYRSFPDDGKHYQIINGELFMSPSPRFFHQHIVFNILRSLGNFLETNPLGVAVSAPMDVILSETDVVQPDILVILNENKHIITVDNIVGAPDFIIEILSPSNRVIDLKKKRALYELHGVKEYWIIDPDIETIQKLVLKENRYEEVMMFDNEKDKKISSNMLKGFSIDGKIIFKK
ncbi:MAG: Uma2 family endonuclease [Ignavibacteriales bacterium]|nr:Uma2 family endonuclease [Ignavibacteriales bacterium]